MKSKKKVLLVGWDAADWNIIMPLVDKGEMPALASLMKNGAYGNIATLEPPASPILWTSVATGKLPHKHGILGFIEPNNDMGGIRPVRSTSRKAHALWNIFTHQGLTSNVVSWWPSHPAEPIKGNMVSNLYQSADTLEKGEWPMPLKGIHPSTLTDELAALRIRPGDLTEQHLLPFIPQLHKVDLDKDNRPYILAKLLAETATVHAAATHLIENEEWDFTAVYYDGIDHFSHAFMKFHPPLMDGLNQEMFDLYKEVVNGIYKFHDMMLERLLELAGPETTVIVMSDHGFYSDHQRPKYIPTEHAGPTVEHRPYGMLCMSGPGIEPGSKIYGATLLDIAPTILHLMGLPVGKDMDGKILLKALNIKEAPTYIPTWEGLEGNFGAHAEDLIDNPWETQRALRQLIELGYVQDPGEDKKKAADLSVMESQLNLARSYMSVQESGKANAIMKELYEQYPEDRRVKHFLLQTFITLNQKKDARALLNKIKLSNDQPLASTDLMEAKLLIQEKRLVPALDLLEKLSAKHPDNISLLSESAKVYLSLQRLSSALACYDKILAQDQDHAHAWMGKGTCQLRQGLYEDAIESLLQSVQLLYHNAVAHYRLGEALMMAGQEDYALQAFKTAVSIAPGMSKAHQWLIKLYHQAGMPDDARYHQEFIQSKINRPIVIVSGLPRSGTSMMMQMLMSGGAEIMTDHKRNADNNNPKGYLEYEPVKSLAQDNSWVAQAQGKTLKVVSHLLQNLPADQYYKIIFMERELDEVLKSQQKMIGAPDKAYPALLAITFKEQVEKIKRWMERQPNIEVIYMPYADVVQQPHEAALKVNQFIDDSLDIVKMAESVDPDLYRNQKPVWK